MPAFIDTAALVKPATPDERAVAEASYDIVARNVVGRTPVADPARSRDSDAFQHGMPRPTRDMGHNEYSLAMQAAMVGFHDVEDVRSGVSRNYWTTALIRLQRSEAARSDKIHVGSSQRLDAPDRDGNRKTTESTVTYQVPDPLSTIERARHLRTDMALQENALNIIEAKHGPAELRDRKPVPTRDLSLMMGVDRAQQCVDQMSRMSSQTLHAFLYDQPIEGADAIRLGSMVNSSLNARQHDADKAIADGMGVLRKPGFGDALLGRGRDKVEMLAPGEERHRMRALEAELGLEPKGAVIPADRNRPFIGDASLHGDTPGQPSPVRGAEKRMAHFLKGGDELEVRIKAEKEFLESVSKMELRRTFKDVMPAGPVPDDKAGRDKWTDAALRNEYMMVVGGTLSRDAAIEASLRERGPVSDMAPVAAPQGLSRARADVQTADLATNLARVDDRMLKGRFQDVHGIDAMPIPTEPRERSEWIMAVGRIDIARRDAAVRGRIDVLPKRDMSQEKAIDEKVKATVISVEAAADRGRTASMMAAMHHGQSTRGQ